MNIVIIIVDLGHFKAYRMTQAPMESPRLELLESYESIDGHARLGDTLSDSAGRFAGGGGSGEPAKGYGDVHNLELEVKKKVLKTIVKDINRLIGSEKCERWHLAAGEQINSQILDELKPHIRDVLDKNIVANLTKISKAEIVKRFA